MGRTKHQAVDPADDGETCMNLEEKSMTVKASSPSKFSLFQENQAFPTREPEPENGSAG
jgi:hypothetical protein